ncbi:MAG TPA: ATP-binding protein [Terriglobales bacterium]|nr:ATP-binding protein [Terriglobales bacterium]
MNATPTLVWNEANQSWLTTALAEVRVALMQFLAISEDQNAREEHSAGADAQPEQNSSTESATSALDVLCATFGLSDFERKVLLMSAGAELDSRFASLYAAGSRDARCSHATFSLALSAFEDAHWSALLPTRPLRHWHLVEVVSGDGLTNSPLRIDERILHYLAGISCIDDRLRGLTEPVREAGALPPSQKAVADQMAESWYRANWQTGGPVLQLCGAQVSGKRAVASTACARLGLSLRVIASSVVPRAATDLDLFIRLWEREVALGPTALLVECDDSEATEAAGGAAVKRLLETLRSPLMVAVRERRRPTERVLLSFDVPKPTSGEQQQIWKEALGGHALALNGFVDRLVAQFSLDASEIYAAVSRAVSGEKDPVVNEEPSGDAPVVAASSIAEAGIANSSSAEPSSKADFAAGLATDLWEVCRTQSRPRLEGLAQRMEPAATWDDLVLPERQKQIVRQIALHLRQRNKVYQRWGFASKGSRGLGISALFAGPSGTGKTMSGEVLANELRLDLYRIDLSQVVSKYIGETEKNLRSVFDAAEDGGAILLFDEADALFGKRSEVKDSRDRYANIEVSYLLQRMEAYRGLAILTTNRKDALDQAFLRRIRFVVEFPFPEAAQRAEIWRRVFPRQTPTEGLRIDRLARLTAAGGHIHNIAIGAAFLAADAGEPVRMSHLLAAARSEFAKLERPLTDSEVAGWA